MPSHHKELSRSHDLTSIPIPWEILDRDPSWIEGFGSLCSNFGLFRVEHGAFRWMFKGLLVKFQAACMESPHIHTTSMHIVRRVY